MKKLFIIAALTLLIAGCNEDKKKENTMDANAVAYQSFGDKISDEGVLSKAEIIEKYKGLQAGDTVTVKFTSEVKEVCQNKGCWMRMDMGEEEAMVKFKDYGFFMPKDIAGQSVIVEGVAFVEEVSVEEQRHYAEDAGKSKKEIEAITEPKRTLSFISSGVLLPDTNLGEPEKQ
ncbi:uncharacterized protein DUF4920 [Ulvibacter sp. MAR_2010_11]|uniref:DUF4920 domain-containing protein n=1 Tax=Ulvibacter sp. MAR_2010_11 TaxID=1250229 RepID=UPI000C2C96DE|nr:DUF4920 domain-containing protein [Ulvibacter sp. MAR_2010_11]PKA82189.1 uncharacterized protein DUF4920 [Ulvibacter sp. MAR_2010_11]